MTAAIQAEGLVKTYGEVTAPDGVDLSGWNLVPVSVPPVTRLYGRSAR
ncbi:hypothetical protein SAMN05421874_1114 [Nonomuraea maritima]|uniref:Uncharacterized protein n=1 Tax=Nonomuraea maritima TaxID=683260 RepID=A0A1G9EIW4_9ACTN|nr:hypothetical protein [Nonomuraea maritima]SDK76102.1 hypothetical protein SAMN05421874_1114 [Nonomuraea maritima]